MKWEMKIVTILFVHNHIGLEGELGVAINVLLSITY